MEKVVFATQQYVDKSIEDIPGGSGNFVKIATGSNINLATVQANILTYEDGIDASNSIETRLIITRVNDTDTYDSAGDTAEYAYVADGSIVISAPALGVIAELVDSLERGVKIINDIRVSSQGTKNFNVTSATGAPYRINIEVWGIKLS